MTPVPGPPKRLAATARRLAPYKWRIVGGALLLAAFVVLFIVAIAGSVQSGPFAEALIAIPILVLLVAGGNWLQSYLGITRPSPKFARPDYSASGHSFARRSRRRDAHGRSTPTEGEAEEPDATGLP